MGKDTKRKESPDLGDTTVPGKLLGPNSLFLRTSAGEADDGKGNKYELSFSMNGTPIVRNEKSLMTYTLSWTDLIDLAKRKGIDTRKESK